MCKIYGYARISRPTQNIDRQIRNIEEYNDTAIISKEAYTGTTQERPQWKRLLSKVKSGDTIIFDSVSRMSRNAEEGFTEYQQLYNDGINLVFLKEHHIDTATFKSALSQQIELTGNEIADEYIKATNNVLMILAKQQIRLAFEQAQKEVDDIHNRTSEGLKTAKINGKIHNRTSEGLKTAKINGKRVGRKQGETVTTKKSVAAKQIILKHSIDFGGSLTDKEVMQMIGGISRNTYYKYKKELKQ